MLFPLAAHDGVHLRIEIRVMRELNMPPHIPSEARIVGKRGGQSPSVRGPFEQQPVRMAQFMQAPSRSESRWTRAQNENPLARGGTGVGDAHDTKTLRYCRRILRQLA